MPTSSRRIVHHVSSRGEWEMVAAVPPPVLRDYVREYTWWTEFTSAPLLRRELPTEEVPLIFNFGAPVRLLGSGGSADTVELGSFTTGAYDTFVLVETAGRSAGLQINLTLLGARMLAGRPLRDYTNRAVSLREIFGRDGDLLESELYDARGWEARFAILDRELLRRVLSAVALPDAVRFGWHRLVRSRGRATIGSIVNEVGRSHRHFVAQFTEHMGLTPKTLGRVLRFGRAVATIKAGRAHSLTELAHACGYYDQPHFVRDCRSLAGVTPTELVGSLLPDRGGFLVDGSDFSKHPDGAAATFTEEEFT